MTNVINLFQEITANEILKESIDRYEDCIIIGVREDSAIEFRTNISNAAELNTNLDVAKLHVLHSLLAEE